MDTDAPARPATRTPPARSAPRRAQRRLKGTEKAAILFLCLGEKRGSALMRRLQGNDIERITEAMTRLGSIPAEEVEAVLLEFAEGVAGGAGVVGTKFAAEAILREFLPEDEVGEIMRTASGQAREKDMWRRFAALSDNAIANYLKGEHDQTAAAILSNVEPAVAARVLPLLGPERMVDVAERMIAMEAVPLHMMRQLEEALRTDIMSDATHCTDAETEKRMAETFNRLDAKSFESLSGTLAARIPDSFAAIKSRMFTFEDLMKLEITDLAQVMRGVDGATLPLALRGASKEIREHFLTALPARSRTMLTEEMETMGAVRVKDVHTAQAALVDCAKSLAEQDVIQIPMGDEEMIGD